MSDPDNGGLRYDEGKNRLDLIPIEWIWALGQLMTKGAVKYAPRNWERGMAWSKVLGPLLRHLIWFLAGEKYDKETGVHHMVAVAWNALALFSYDIRGVGENDVAGKLEWINAALGPTQSQESIKLNTPVWQEDDLPPI